MTQIRNAQGNNLGEIMSDTINQVVNQFSEGINSGVNGFKQMFGNGGGIQSFANNVQQSSHNSHLAGGPPSADQVRSQMLASEKVMQAKEVDFFGGPEDTRAVSQTKQVGSQ